MRFRLAVSVVLRRGVVHDLRERLFDLLNESGLLRRGVNKLLRNRSVRIADKNLRGRISAVLNRIQVFIHFNAVTLKPLDDLMGFRDISRNLSDLLCGNRSARRNILHDNVLAAVFGQEPVKLFVRVDVTFAFLAANLVKRRLRNVDVPCFHQRLQFTEEEREKKRSDMRTVHIGIGHDHDAVVAQSGNIEILFAVSASDRGDQGLDFIVVENLVDPRLLHIEEFTPDRDDRLKTAVAPLLRGTACRVALDDVKFAFRGVLFRAVGKFSEERGKTVQGSFALDKFPRLFRGFAGTGSNHRLVHDLTGYRGIFLKE